MAPPALASGPMHVDHIAGRPIVIGLAGYEFACAGCAFDLGKANIVGKKQECLDIIYKGLHIENFKVFDRPNIKPLSTPLTTYNAWGVVPGPSIIIKSAPDSGFNVVCPLCAFYLGNDNSSENYNILAQGLHIFHRPTPATDVSSTTTNNEEEKDTTTTTTNNEEEKDTTTTTTTNNEEEKDTTTTTTNNEEEKDTTTTTTTNNEEEKDTTTTTTNNEEEKDTTTTTTTNNEEKDTTTTTTNNEEKDTTTTTNNEEKDTTTTANNEEKDTTTENEKADEKRTTAVFGNDGVAGIYIKGGEIDIEMEAPPANANPTTKPAINLSVPIEADDVVAYNHGVAGINLKGTGKVKLVIGKSTQ